MIPINNRKLYLMLLKTLFPLVLAGCKQTIDARQLEQINGLYYKLNEHDPFTGTVINNIIARDFTLYYSVNCTINYKNGQMDGELTCYSPTEKIKITEMRLKNNLKHGTEKVWDNATGGLKWKIEWKDGMHDGLEEHYNSTNGQMIAQIHWKENQKDGDSKRWDINGDVLLESLHWKDGKQTGFSKSADNEINFKDGKQDGIRRKYNLVSTYEDYGLTCPSTFGAVAYVCSYTMVDHSIELEEMYENGELMWRKIKGEDVPFDDPETTDFN